MLAALRYLMLREHDAVRLKAFEAAFGTREHVSFVLHLCQPPHPGRLIPQPQGARKPKFPKLGSGLLHLQPELDQPAADLIAHSPAFRSAHHRFQHSCFVEMPDR
jgi:hypothetical protein